MRRSTLLRQMLFAAVLLLAFAAGFAGETLAGPTPIGCQADGFCNTSCASDPDCGAPSCQHGKPCVTDADCQPLGECAVWRQCVCFG